MAPHTFWKGYLKLSLVTCPVTMMPALTDQEKVRFHTLNARTGNRVVSRYVDSDTGRAVKEGDEVRAWQRGEGDFVLLEDEEIEAVALDSTRTIDIERFVKRDTVEWIWFDRPHYVMPSDPVGEEAFVVIRDAMEATGTAGLSRVVMYRRERPVLLEPRDKGIVLWTLRYGEEVRDAADYFGGIGKPKVETALARMMAKLVDARKADWDSAMVEDPVQDKLLDLIEARRKKQKGKGATRRKKVDQQLESAGNVVSIMDALRKSLDKGKKPG